MFDPKKMVSPLTALKDEVGGNLSKVLLNEDNTVVKSVRHNNAYHNTAAVINTIDASGAVIREDRELLYDRINLEEHIKKFSKFHREDDGDVSYALLTDTVTETNRNANATQLARVLIDVHKLPISEDDLIMTQRDTLEPKTTPFGKVYSSINCAISKDMVTYRGGAIPIPVMGHYDYAYKSLVTDVQPGFSIIRQWVQGEKLELDLPNMSIADDWTICVELVDVVDYNSPGKILFVMSLDANLNSWVVYKGYNVVGSFDAFNNNTITVSTIDGMLKLRGNSNDSSKIDINDTKIISTASEGLQRITVFTKNPSRQDIQFNMTVKKPASTYIPSVSGPTYHIGTTEYDDGVRKANRNTPELEFGITSDSTLDNRMIAGMVWDIANVDTFDVRVFNRTQDGGDYSGLDINHSYLIVTDKSNYIENVKSAIVNNFTSTDVVGVSLSSQGEDGLGAFINADRLQVPPDTYGSYSSLKLSVNKLTGIITYTVLFGPVNKPELAVHTFTGDIENALSGFENPIVLMITAASVNSGGGLFLHGIESDALPLSLIEVNPINVNNYISASPSSNALVGNLTLPVAITNTLCSGYTENVKNTFKSEVNAINSGFGSITKLVNNNNVDTNMLTYNVANWSTLIESRALSSTFIEVVNAEDVTDVFRVQLDTNRGGSGTLNVYQDGTLISTALYVEHYSNEFTLEIGSSGMLVKLDAGEPIINSAYNALDKEPPTKFRVEFGVTVNKRTTLPTIVVTNDLILGDGGQS